MTKIRENTFKSSRRLNNKIIKEMLIHKKHRNICDECKSELEKTYVMTEFDIPFVCWVCPKSECYRLYRKYFKKKYQRKEAGK